MTDYYSTIDAARLTGISHKMIQHWAGTDRLHAHKWMGVYRITADDLTAFMQERAEVKTRCRNGHDLRQPNAIRLVGSKQERRCRACIAGISRRRYLRRHGGEPALMLAERNPGVFRRLADETRDMPPYKRLSAALYFWECAV